MDELPSPRYRIKANDPIPNKQIFQQIFQQATMITSMKKGLAKLTLAAATIVCMS
jgi:hypothetical protein